MDLTDSRYLNITNAFQFSSADLRNDSQSC